MRSDASEADLSNHLQNMVEDIKTMKFDSWRNNISVDQDTKYPVEIEIEET